MSSAATLKAVATGQVAQQRKTLFDHIQNPQFGKAIAAVAGKYLTPDRMLRLCINAVKKTPKLMECDPQSVLGAMMASAALGLEPNTLQQQAFLIPYKRRAKVGDQWVDVYDCQFQVGARGFVTLAYRSPQIKLLTAEAIHDGDKWEHEVGSQSFLRYAKNLRNRGALLGAFSYVRFEGGDEGACVLPFDELMKIRSKSETFRSLTERLEKADNEKDRKKAEAALAETPWVMWEDDMCSKSAIKKHAKQLPLAGNDVMAVAADLDDKSDHGVLDTRALTDVDVVRAVVSDEAEAPALDNNPTETLQASGEAFGTVARQAAAVPAGGDQPDAQAAGTKVAKSRTKAAKSYAQLADEVLKAKDADAAAVVLDEARGVLPEQQLAELGQVYRNKWEAA